MQIFAVKDNNGNVRTTSANDKVQAMFNFIKMGIRCLPCDIAVKWWKD